jgi:glycosyltransferase involved in cell wall biosynthesis
MSNTTQISVILTTYNTNSTYLERAVQSVLAQDFQDFELIIVDDGSSYEYSTKILQYCTDYSGKIIYIYQHNQGQSQAANRGVLNSKGQYVTFLDSDDEYKTNHLSSCIKEIQQADLICSTATLVGDTEQDLHIPDRNNLNELVHIDDTVLFATLFGKREVFNTIRFIDGYAADAEFFEQASKQYTTKKLNLRTYIYYRNIPNSLSTVIRKTHETLH